MAQPPAPPFFAKVEEEHVPTLFKTYTEGREGVKNGQDLVKLIQVLKYRPADDGDAV